MKRTLLIVALCCGAWPALARDANLTDEYAACMDKSGGVTAAMVDCMNSETRRQDARLNQAYKDVMAQLPEARKKQLQEAQRAWLRFRDANCRYYADPDGGTLARVEANGCFMSATAARARELESFRR